MNDVLLQTKLYIPRLRPSLIPRPRLVAKLGQGFDSRAALFNGRLALISAPAGYGKTTLVSEWLAQLSDQEPLFGRQHGAICWLSLDEQDNDPARFLTYVIAALRGAVPDLGQEVQATLASTRTVPIEPLLTYLINELALLDQPVILVLDDYHLIREQAIHHALTFLLDNQPPNLYLVFTTRRDPPFPLARWRARGQLLEMREADLKFTRQEIETFFQQAAGVDLDEGSLVTLEDKTEGWAASLQLAAIAVRTPESQADESQLNRIIKSFGGTHHYMVDYLLSEVMAQRPRGTRQFLLQTSILDRFTVALCQAITERQDSRELIDQLEAANLFLIPLDEQRHWYRYHHLFATLLQQRLKEQEPDQIPYLYQKASIWQETHGFLEDAIESALAGGHLERAADLISGVAKTAVWQQGQYVRLERWINQLPQTLISVHPQLCVYYAWALFANPEQLDKSAPDRWLAFAEKAAGEFAEPGQDGRAIRGQVAAIRCFQARIKGDIAGTIDQAEKAVGQLPTKPSFWRAIVLFNLAAALFLGDDDQATQRALLAAKREAHEAGDRLVELGSMNMLAQLKRRQGDLRRSEAAYRQALESEQRFRMDLPWLITGGMADLGLGQLFFERNDLLQAAEHLERGMQIGRRAQHPITMLAGGLVAARLAQARGDLAAASTLIEEGGALAEATGQTWTWLTGPVASALARLWIRQGEPLLAQDVLQNAPQMLSGRPQLSGYWRENILLAQVRLLLVQDDPDSAVRHLAQLETSAEQTGRQGSLVEILMLQSLCFRLQEQTQQALSSLSRALSLAGRGAYVRLFVAEGSIMEDLLHQLPETPFRNDLLDHFPPSIAGETLTAHVLQDPLTEREMEVLRLMTSHLSGPGIARELHISINTYKSHLKNIYGKLSVRSRAAAVARAQALHLL